MEAAPKVRTAALLVVLLTGLALVRSIASAAPPAPAGERWVGLRVTDPELRRLAVLDVTGPLNGVADAIPFLVIALDDESAPVRAAARERLQALATEAVDPLLSALEGARPGSKNTFGVLSALGTAVTPTDFAAGAGAMTPTQPPDRRESALLLAVYAPRRLGAAAPQSIDERLRIASLLLVDADESVRRAAAASLGLLGLVAVEESLSREGLVSGGRVETGFVPERRAPKLALSRGQRERLVELIHHGSPEIARCAAALAARFGDDGETVVKALADLLEVETARDAAGLALAALGEASRPVLAALKRHRSYGTWRALVRLHDDSVGAALAGKNREARRLAAAATFDQVGGSEAVAQVFLDDLEEAREDGAFAKLQRRLLPLWVLGGDGAVALPTLAKIAGEEKCESDVRDLAAAVALRVDRSVEWAKARVGARLTNPPSPKPGPDGAPTRLVTATVIAIALERELTGLDLPPAVATVDLLTATLDGAPLGLAFISARPLTATSPYVALLTRGLDAPPEQRPSAWKPPTLWDYAQRGPEVAASWWVRKAALDVLGDPALATPERKALLLALGDAPDPWLRHLAARAARRSGAK